MTAIAAGVASHGWAALADLPRLRNLQLSRISAPSHLAELATLTGLRSLSLSNVAHLKDLSPLAFLTAPVSLRFKGCKSLEDLTLLERWAAELRRLRVTACPSADPAPIAELTKLQLLDLQGTRLSDLSFLSALRRLKDLQLRDLPAMLDLTPLAKLDQLEMVTVTGRGGLDLRPLAGRPGLHVRVSDLIVPIGADLLGPGSTVAQLTAPYRRHPAT